MKKILITLFALLMALSLVACGDPAETTAPDTTITPDTTDVPSTDTTEIPTESGSDTEPADTQTPPDTESEETTESTAAEVSDSTFVDVRETVYVTGADVLNIRKSYSSDSEKVGEMKEGESVTRTGYNAEWSRISYYGETYYAKSAYLTTVAPFEYTTKAETVYVNIAQLNLRAKASPEATIVVTLKFGDAVERTGVSTTKDENGNEWSRILYNGQVCYANSLYLSDTPSESEKLSFEEKNDTVYTIAETTVNLRSDASVDSTIVASLEYGTVLQRTGIAAAPDADGILWSRVTFEGKTCYITTAQLSETPTVSFADADETVYITADSLNIRSIPSFTSGVLKAPAKGTALKCTGKATAADADGIVWYRVVLGDITGYASSAYLSTEKPE